MTMKTTLAALLTTVLSTPLMAATCSVDLEGNDAMQFNKTSIAVPASCKQFSVKLKHVGKLPAAAMGHNWVLTRTADMQAVATEGMKAGLPKNYINDADPRVLAHTKVIGGGESDSVTFDVSKLAAGQDYAYFCSFPGHFAVMKGVLKLAD